METNPTPDTLASLNHQAMELLQQGKHAEAETQFRAVLKARQARLETEYIDMLTSLNNLATTLFIQNKHAEAVAQLRAELPVAGQVLGTKTPFTKQLRGSLRVIENDRKKTEAQQKK